MRSLFRDSSRRLGAFRLFARLLAGALLLLLGAGCALPGLHFAAVAHEICAEHGDLHHAEGSATDAQARSTQPEAPAVFGASSTAEHVHDHCSVVSSNPPGTAILRETVPLGISEPAPRERAMCDCEAKRNLDVLSYAPKLAPPV